MSRENVELVLRALAASAKRPKPDWDTMNALIHPDHVLVGALQRGLGEAAVEGAVGYRNWLEESPDVMAYEWDVESAIDVGRETVLAVGTVRFKGAASGVTEERRAWFLVTLSYGKIVRTELFFDPAEALEAGLRPE